MSYTRTDKKLTESKMDLIKECLEETCRVNIEEKSALIEFWTDKAGQDIPVEIEYDGTDVDFVEKFNDFAENYDVDEEVELYVNMRSKDGVPSTVREILEDCEEAKETLMKLAKGLKEILEGGSKNENA